MMSLLTFCNGCGRRQRAINKSQNGMVDWRSLKSAAAFETTGKQQALDCAEILRSGTEDLPKSILPILQSHVAEVEAPATKKPKQALTC